MNFNSFTVQYEASEESINIENTFSWEFHILVLLYSHTNL